MVTESQNPDDPPLPIQKWMIGLFVLALLLIAVAVVELFVTNIAMAIQVGLILLALILVPYFIGDVVSRVMKAREGWRE